MQHLKSISTWLGGWLRRVNEAANPPCEGPSVSDSDIESLSEHPVVKAMGNEIQRLNADLGRLRLAMKRRDEMIATLIDEYDQTLAAEGKREPKGGAAEDGI